MHISIHFIIEPHIRDHEGVSCTLILYHAWPSYWRWLYCETSILHSVSSATTLSMPHSTLINELCRHAVVTWDDQEEFLPPKVDIEFQGKAMKRRWVVDDASGSKPIPLQVRHSTPARHERTMDDKMTALDGGMELQRKQFEAHQNKMKDYYRQSREHKIYMHEYTTALAQRFPSSS